MSYVNALVAFSKGGLTGLQTCQRDWSPYLVHFTSYGAMDWVRKLSSAGVSPEKACTCLKESDARSADKAREIIKSGQLTCHSPSDKDGIPACVCMSECNLPGLISQSERYGRFGFVLRKSTVHEVGGRPCAYVAEDEYTTIAKRGRGLPPADPDGHLFALANVYAPPGNGKIQDSTHDREGRVFSDVPLSEHLAALIAPDAYCTELRKAVGADVHVIPIDMLFEWGA
jgi:hypothetical protein